MLTCIDTTHQSPVDVVTYTALAPRYGASLSSDERTNRQLANGSQPRAGPRFTQQCGMEFGNNSFGHSTLYLQGLCAVDSTHGHRKFIFVLGKTTTIFRQFMSGTRVSNFLQRLSLLGVFLKVDKLAADFPARRDHHAEC
jgi:hypothetical protein